MRTATLRRTLPATPEQVWRMWSTKDGLESWYFPDYLRPAVRELDLRAGGRYRIVAPGLAFEAEGTFLEVSPPTRLRLRVAFPFDEARPVFDREEHVTLRATPQGCEVTLTSSPLPDEGARSAVEGAWALALHRLEAALRASAPP